MALVKMIRAVPEVAGGKTSCEIPEDSVEAAIRDGWSIAKDSPKSESKKDDKNFKAEPVKEEPKVEDSKADSKKEESKEFSKNKKRDE